jgi:hypothetical protein
MLWDVASNIHRNSSPTMVSFARPRSKRTSSRAPSRMRLLSLFPIVLTTFTCSFALLGPVLVLGSIDSVALGPVVIGIIFGDTYTSVVW